jgi:4-amino-4-deoxy-L-arabinose transferase-like glycosyltransferase
MGPRWAALLGVTLMVTSPFLYCFSRLAILEPLQTALTLAALNLAVRLPRMRRPVLASAGIGLLFALTMLTKTTAVFLLPA